MEKKDLKNGMLVETRCNNYYIVLKGDDAKTSYHEDKDGITLINAEWGCLTGIKEDLTLSINDNFDIIRIWDNTIDCVEPFSTESRKILWDRIHQNKVNQGLSLYSKRDQASKIINEYYQHKESNNMSEKDKELEKIIENYEGGYSLISYIVKKLKLKDIWK